MSAVWLDWGGGEMKSAYGLEKNKTPNATTSLSAGIRILGSKGFKVGVSNDKSTGQSTFKFKGWNSAVEQYNGGGTAGYQSGVLKMMNESKKPQASNY
ncbi:hypothetical protein [Chitinophaga rhizosphaerae]|uniref:hypothetical protein n=1 Tax=Chitinophaga rhizosphaerae TaxID=1864947 RepID=UPI000F81473A|nr:hypothetical protein [Chitinophaga rhizosphaerae]